MLQHVASLKRAYALAADQLLAIMVLHQTQVLTDKPWLHERTDRMNSQECNGKADRGGLMAHVPVCKHCGSSLLYYWTARSRWHTCPVLVCLLSNVNL